MTEVDSDEARRLAYNASRRRSYAKNRESINKKRRDIYRLTNGERRTVGRRQVHPFHYRDPISDRSHRPGSPIRTSAQDSLETQLTQVNSVPLHSALYTEALEKIEAAYINFVQVTQATPKGYAHIAYQLYQESIATSPPNGSRRVFDKAILEMSSIAQTIRECRRVVLDSNDEGDNRIFDLALDPVSRLVDWIEEMLREALVSPEGLRHKYIHKELAYQNYVSTRDMYQWFGMRRRLGPRAA
ncbi:uncharacterized protein ARMOST_13955 [Armillaria ostoyae]|uniref:Uncharacterized protein n=1 Tax=Armillaria ostoyae TaxID=47428 RepID=A0A284RPB9_ARMOS|nr:uncharacterized protein ARMOST_13955 [Armillaria ostoyae]